MLVYNALGAEEVLSLTVTNTLCEAKRKEDLCHPGSGSTKRRWAIGTEWGFDPPRRWSVLGEGLFNTERGGGGVTAGLSELDPKDRPPGIKAAWVLPGGGGNGGFLHHEDKLFVCGFFVKESRLY